jgi:hypothetical protein
MGTRVRLKAQWLRSSRMHEPAADRPADAGRLGAPRDAANPRGRELLPARTPPAEHFRRASRSHFPHGVRTISLYFWSLYA